MEEVFKAHMPEPKTSSLAAPLLAVVAAGAFGGSAVIASWCPSVAKSTAECTEITTARHVPVSSQALQACVQERYADARADKVDSPVYIMPLALLSAFSAAGALALSTGSILAQRREDDYVSAAPQPGISLK